MPVTADTKIEVSHKGDVSQRSLEVAVEKVTHVAEHCREPVLHLEVRLIHEANPAHDHPSSAEATLDVQGRPVRAHATAPTIDEAIDLLADRLRRRLAKHEDKLHHLHDRRPRRNP